MREIALGVWRVTHDSGQGVMVNLFIASSLADLAGQWQKFCGTSPGDDDYDDPDKVECIAHENAIGDDPGCAGFVAPESEGAK